MVARLKLKGIDGGSHKRWKSEEHTSELSHTVISYAVFCLKKKTKKNKKKYKKIIHKKKKKENTHLNQP